MGGKGGVIKNHQKSLKIVGKKVVWKKVGEKIKIVEKKSAVGKKVG